RTMAPTKSLMASGRSVFLMKVALAEAAGQVSQPMSPAPTTWPVLRSVLATSTSTVASGGGGGTALGASGCRRPFASMAAAPPAARATPSTIRRAAFITLHVPKWPDRGNGRQLGISPAKRQGMVNEEYPNRVNRALRRASSRPDPTLIPYARTGARPGLLARIFAKAGVHLDQGRSKLSHQALRP